MLSASVLAIAWLAIPCILGFMTAACNRQRDPRARYGSIALTLYFLTPSIAATSAVFFGAAAVGGVSEPSESLQLVGRAASMVGIAAVALVIPWAWVGKSHGRNCRKCRYDMAGASMTCPECGHTAKSERQLHKPIRRTRTLAATIVLLLLVGGAIAVRRSVDASVQPPFVAVAFVAPHVDASNWWRKQFDGRLRTGNYNKLELWAIRRAGRMHLREDRDYGFGLSVLSRINDDDPRVGRDIDALFQQLDEHARVVAAISLWPQAAVSEETMEIVRDLLTDSHERIGIAYVLMRIDRPWLEAHVRAVSRDADHEHYRIAGWIASELGVCGLDACRAFVASVEDGYGLPIPKRGSAVQHFVGCESTTEHKAEVVRLMATTQDVFLMHDLVTSNMIDLLPPREAIETYRRIASDPAFLHSTRYTARSRELSTRERHETPGDAIIGPLFDK